MFIIDSTFSTKTLVKFGAKVNFLIADGEFIRFFTPMFLHLSFYHLGFNCLAIYILGRDIEVIFGKKKFLLIYFFSGFVSTLASFLLNDSISAGASGAVFGLLGSHVFLYFTFKEKYKRIYGNSFLILIGINLALGIIHQNIDNAGHLGGLIGGIIASYSLHVKSYNLNLKRKLIAFVLVPVLTLSVTYYGISNYKFTIKYYIYKAVTLIQMQEYTEANSTLLEGKIKYPQVSDFNYLLNELNKRNDNND